MLTRSLKGQIRETIRKYLPAADCQIFIFGSRVTGENQPFSDLDVGILAPKIIPGHLMVKIQEELENSRIPFKIDIVDFQKVSDPFRELALKNLIYLWKSKN